MEKERIKFEFITRTEYNYLVEYAQDWVAKNWLGLSRDWRYNGVGVTGKESTILEMRKLLDSRQK